MIYVTPFGGGLHHSINRLSPPSAQPATPDQVDMYSEATYRTQVLAG